MFIDALKNRGFKEEFTYLEPRLPNNINNSEVDMNKENTNYNNKVNGCKNEKRKII